MEKLNSIVNGLTAVMVFAGLVCCVAALCGIL